MKLIIDRSVNEYLNDYEFKYNEFGKPYIINDEFYFNKSSSKDLSVLVIDSKECGIDIEFIREYDEIMSSKIFSLDEYNFVNSKKNRDYYFTILWTLKESYLKMIGTGINVKLNSISFVKDSKLLFRNYGYRFKIIKIKDYIISVCFGE